MALIQLHTILGRAFMLFAGLMALLGGFTLLRRREPGGDFWGAVVIGEGLIAAQVLVGLVLLLRGGWPARPLHFVYGALCLLMWPAVFAFTQGETGRREMLFWTLASAALAALAWRAIATGGL
ncbi:MAG TPA: hypothetical protein ENI95_03570 [Chloroflexi bacterium]|nr:hypothetical protein [Chloroflexota bacterium]